MNILAKERSIEQETKALNEDAGFGTFVRIRHDVFIGPHRSRKPPEVANPANRHRNVSEERYFKKVENYAKSREAQGKSPPRREWCHYCRDARKNVMEALNVNPNSEKLVLRTAEDLGVDPETIDGSQVEHWTKAPKPPEVMKKPVSSKVKGKGKSSRFIQQRWIFIW